MKIVSGGLRSRALRIGTAVLACGVFIVSTTESAAPNSTSTGHLTTASEPVQATKSAQAAASAAVDASRTLLAPPSTAVTKTDQDTAASNEKTCVSAEFATLGAVVRTVFDSFIPMLPKANRGAAESAKAAALRDMSALEISSLAVTNHPTGLGASKDAPMHTYRDPLSQWIVTQLMNVKNGQAAKPISVDNLTVLQAAETAWLYFYVTAVIPLTLVESMLPADYEVGPVSIGTLITLPATIGAGGMKLFYRAIESKLVGGCLARMTKDEKEIAGKPNVKTDFAAEVPEIIEAIAGRVAIAEPGSCPAIAELSLSEIVAQTSSYLQEKAVNAADAATIKKRTEQLQRFMRLVPVPDNLIPDDPTSDSTVVDLIDRGLGIAPDAAITAEGVLSSLRGTIESGSDAAKTVPLAELTVNKTLTAAYYAYSLSSLLFGFLNEAAAKALLVETGGVDMMPRLTGLYNVPKTYGLVVFHNTVRSLCLPGTSVKAAEAKDAESDEETTSPTTPSPTTTAPSTSTTTPKPSDEVTPETSTEPTSEPTDEIEQTTAETAPKPSASVTSTATPLAE